MADGWPRYKIAPREHLEALGAITINWNTLEIMLFMVLRHYIRAPDDSAQAIFFALGNTSRTDLLLTMARKVEKRADVLARVEHFAKAYDICRENRNWLMHAWPDDQPDGDNLVLKKTPSRSPFIAHTLSIPVEALRDVADSIRGWAEYGSLIFLHIEENRRAHEDQSTIGAPRPLPDIFPLPRKLIQPPQKQGR